MHHPASPFRLGKWSTDCHPDTFRVVRVKGCAGLGSRAPFNMKTNMFEIRFNQICQHICRSISVTRAVFVLGLKALVFVLWFRVVVFVFGFRVVRVSCQGLGRVVI